MDKKENFKEKIVTHNLALNAFIREYFLEKYNLAWGVAELNELRKEAKVGRKTRAILEHIMSQEDFPFEWRNIEGEDVLVYRYEL